MEKINLTFITHQSKIHYLLHSVGQFDFTFCHGQWVDDFSSTVFLPLEDACQRIFTRVIAENDLMASMESYATHHAGPVC